MNKTLTINDPLAEQEVTIIITLAASEHPREERPVMVSVGVAAQMPVIRAGVFGDAPALIHEAWTAFGVRAQAAAVPAAEGETEAAEQVVATVTVDNDEPAPPPNLSLPKPQAKNLSLF